MSYAINVNQNHHHHNKQHNGRSDSNNNGTTAGGSTKTNIYKNISNNISRSSSSSNSQTRYPIVKPGFIRVKLIELDPPPNLIPENLVLEPYCIVNVKELVALSSTSRQNTKVNNKLTNKKYKKDNLNVVAAFNAQSNSLNLKTLTKSRFNKVYY
jgi:hypothetical protein